MPNWFLFVDFSLCRCGTLFTLLALTSCHSGYTYTFNNNVVFSPDPTLIAQKGALSDAGLQGCLNQYLALNKALSMEQVTLLACPGSGVETLAGIGALRSLEQLELSDNRIADLRPLSQLSNLRVLGLRNNPVTTVSPLLNMPLLRFVSLIGSDQIACGELAELRSKLGNTLTGPLQCTE